MEGKIFQAKECSEARKLQGVMQLEHGGPKLQELVGAMGQIVRACVGVLLRILAFILRSVGVH